MKQGANSDSPDNEPAAPVGDEAADAQEPTECAVCGDDLKRVFLCQSDDCDATGTITTNGVHVGPALTGETERESGQAPDLKRIHVRVTREQFEQYKAALDGKPIGHDLREHISRVTEDGVDHDHDPPECANCGGELRARPCGWIGATSYRRESCSAGGHVTTSGVRHGPAFTGGWSL